MQDLYKTLGVRRGATASEIRSAFRKKAKKLHPDATGRSDTSNIEAFHALVYAYNVLMDKRAMSVFGKADSTANRTYSGEESRNEEPFDYHKWLIARADDESMAKLVFWDLMHGRENDAVDEYCRLTTERSTFSIKHWFTREDFMDIGYILAEELDLRRRHYEAFALLAEIIKLEKERSYFRFFFPEVLDFALRILTHDIEADGNDELSLDAYEKALELQFGTEEDVYFLGRMAAIYNKIGDARTASLCLDAAARLAKGTA